MPMDLLNATEDSSPCNSMPMNQAHALGVSVGKGRKAIVRMQHWLLGVKMTEAEVHMTTFSLFACADYRR